MRVNLNRKRGENVPRSSAGSERVQALTGEVSKDSDYLFDDDHSVTTGRAFVRFYSRIVLCTFCFFSIGFLKFSSKTRELL